MDAPIEDLEALAIDAELLHIVCLFKDDSVQDSVLHIMFLFKDNSVQDKTIE